MNYFELFGLPQAPFVDKSLLSKKYFELQKENHPDFYTQGTETQQDDSLEKSASINKAYYIFQNTEHTIEYFLQTVGLIKTGEKYNLPPDFLLEMMEINEAISEDDQADVVKQINEYEKALEEEIKPIITGYDSIKTDTGDLLKLKEYYYKKKYLKRILDRLGD
jgi:molecular chaperone HscB